MNQCKQEVECLSCGAVGACVRANLHGDEKHVPKNCKCGLGPVMAQSETTLVMGLKPEILAMHQAGAVLGVVD